VDGGRRVSSSPVYGVDIPTQTFRFRAAQQRIAMRQIPRDGSPGPRPDQGPHQGQNERHQLLVETVKNERSNAMKNAAMIGKLAALGVLMGAAAGVSATSAQGRVTL
jgi:hypothetical protein